mgnify:CR=1 FL=1
MNDNWLIESLKWTFEFWNNKQTEIWQLVSTTPEEFKGGDIWRLALTLNDGLKAIGYGLLVLFFALSICKSTINFRDLRRPEQGLCFFYTVRACQNSRNLRDRSNDCYFQHLHRNCIGDCGENGNGYGGYGIAPKSWKRQSMRWDFLQVYPYGW